MNELIACKKPATEFEKEHFECVALIDGETVIKSIALTKRLLMHVIDGLEERFGVRHVWKS